MRVITEPLDASRIPSFPSSDRQRNLYLSWEKNKGLLTKDIETHYEHLVLFDVPREEEVPEILYIGPKSIAAAVMGQSWRTELQSHISGENAASAYVTAHTGNPALEFVAFSTEIDNKEIQLIYERMVLKFHTLAGYSILATLSTMINFRGIGDHPANLGNQTMEGLRANSPVLLGKESEPKLVHSLFEPKIQ